MRNHLFFFPVALALFTTACAKKEPEPDFMISVHVGSLTKRFRPEIEKVFQLGQHLAESLLTTPTEAPLKHLGMHLLEKLKSRLNHYEKYQLHGSFLDDGVEFGTRTNFAAGGLPYRFKIQEKQLAAWLPSQSLLRMQMAIPVGLLPDFQFVAEDLIQWGANLDKQGKGTFAPYVPLAKEILNHLVQLSDGTQLAVSLEASSENNPTLLGLLAAPKATEALDHIQAVVNILEQISVKMEGKAAFLIDTTPASYGKYTNVRRLALGPNVPNAPKLFEIVQFKDLLAFRMLGDQNNLTSLANAIASGKGTPLQAMKRYPDHGSFYLDLDLQQVEALINEKTPADKRTHLLTKTSPGQAIVSLYGNDDLEDARGKVFIPEAVGPGIREELNQLLDRAKTELPALLREKMSQKKSDPCYQGCKDFCAKAAPPESQAGCTEQCKVQKCDQASSSTKPLL